MTFLSYSASVSFVISTLFAANTRPPLRRQISRSYWHGPISGCLRHISPTFGENSIVVCRRWPAFSETQTYSAFGGIDTGATGIAAGLEGAMDATCGGASGNGRRTTAAPWA